MLASRFLFFVDIHKLVVKEGRSREEFRDSLIL